MRAYTQPRRRVSYIGVAWGWTVYYDGGVWRCLYEDKQRQCPTPFFYTNIYKSPDWGTFMAHDIKE